VKDVLRNRTIDCWFLTEKDTTHMLTASGSLLRNTLCVG